MTILQLQDDNGNVLKESEIHISDSDVLLVEFNREKIDYVQAEQAFKYISKAMQDNKKLIAYPMGFTFKILKRTENNQNF